MLDLVPLVNNRFSLYAFCTLLDIEVVLSMLLIDVVTTSMMLLDIGNLIESFIS